MNLVGTVYEEVLRTQQVAVRELAEGTRVTAPVTVRGDVIGAMDLRGIKAPYFFVLQRDNSRRLV